DHESHYGITLMVEPVSFKNQVLGNIISNAIKFSHPGGFITVSAKAVNEETFAVEIKDTGIGMPEHILNTLFDMNKKTSRPGTIGESGTGFGLHIMRSFVEMYGGKVEVASQEGKGTTFGLFLKGHKK